MKAGACELSSPGKTSTISFRFSMSCMSIHPWMLLCGTALTPFVTEFRSQSEPSDFSYDHCTRSNLTKPVATEMSSGRGAFPLTANCCAFPANSPIETMKTVGS